MSLEHELCKFAHALGGTVWGPVVLQTVFDRDEANTTSIDPLEGMPIAGGQVCVVFRHPHCYIQFVNVVGVTCSVSEVTNATDQQFLRRTLCVERNDARVRVVLGFPDTGWIDPSTTPMGVALDVDTLSWDGAGIATVGAAPLEQCVKGAVVRQFGFAEPLTADDWVALVQRACQLVQRGWTMRGPRVHGDVFVSAARHLAEHERTCPVMKAPAEGDEPMVVLPCGHVVGGGAMCKWVATGSATCPLCRQPVLS
jgi:hypothetical protein